MAKVMRCVVDVVLPTGTAVLNADDEHVVGMAEYSKGGVIYFTSDANNAVIPAHLDSGGRAVILKDGVIHLAHGERERALCPLSDVSLPVDGPFAFHIEDALAAVGAAWAHGLSDEAIASGLRCYEGVH